MKIETEIKIAIADFNIKNIIENIETIFNCAKNGSFHQITHQFFEDDFTKQNTFPRIRNEESGTTTLTVKAKTKESSDFFKRIELETTIGDTEAVIAMMPFLGFAKKISWEKKRHSFTNKSGEDMDVEFFLDETPMGWFLEIEGNELSIENTILKLNLQNQQRINKPYLALWEEYKKEKNISEENMMFSEKQKNLEV